MFFFRGCCCCWAAHKTATIIHRTISAAWRICVVDVLNHTIVVKYYIIVAVELFFFPFAWMPLLRMCVWAFYVLFIFFHFCDCKNGVTRCETHHSVWCAAGGEISIHRGFVVKVPFCLVSNTQITVNELFLGFYFFSSLILVSALSSFREWANFCIQFLWASVSQWNFILNFRCRCTSLHSSNQHHEWSVAGGIAYYPIHTFTSSHRCFNALLSKIMQIFSQHIVLMPNILNELFSGKSQVVTLRTNIQAVLWCNG